MYDFLNYEAYIVEDWPDGIQDLVDKGLVKVAYDEDDKPNFSLTELGMSVRREIDYKLH